MQLTITLKIKKKNMNADKIIKKQGGIMLYNYEREALEDFEKEFGNPHFFKKHKWGDILARLDKDLWFETCGYNYLFGTLGCKFKKNFPYIDVNTEFETAFFKCNIKNNGGSYGVYYIYIKGIRIEKEDKNLPQIYNYKDGILCRV